jgi:hypothetical protein
VHRRRLPIALGQTDSIRDGGMTIWLKRIFITTSIGGGVMGASAVSYTLVSLKEIREVVVAMIVIAFYAVGIVAGVVLAERSRNAIGLMTWFFALQIPIVDSDAISFHLSSMFSVSVVLRGLFTFDIAWFFGTEWQLSLLSESSKQGIGINIVALMMVLLVNRWGAAASR